MVIHMNNEHKFISNNIEYIINLFNRVSHISLTEDLNFKPNINGDLSCYFCKNGEQMMMQYDSYKDIIELYHWNKFANPKSQHKLHLQYSAHNYGAVANYLKSLHDARNMNSKNKVDKLLREYEKSRKQK